MAKKKRNRKPSDLPEALPIEPESGLPQEVNNAPAQVEPPEQVQPPQQEAPAAGPESGLPQEVGNAPTQVDQPETPVAEPEPAREEVEPSLEERISDIRHSLIEEEAREEKKPQIARWLRNKLKGAEEKSQSQQREREEAVEAQEETEVPQSLVERVSAVGTPVAPAAVEVKPPAPQPEQVKPSEYEQEAALFLAGEIILSSDHVNNVEEPKEETQAEGPVAEPVQIVEEKPSFVELKQKLASRKVVLDDFQKIRDVALQDYVEPAPAPKVRQFTSPLEYFKNLILSLTKFEKRLIVGAITAIMLIIVIAYGFSWLKPQPNLLATATAKASLPFPVMVTLPGPWTFSLNRGYVQNGVWNPPAGAEWLDGTEICRVISLPWTLQLESVIRTLKAEDQVELVMSNSDHITYRVQSIRSMAANEWDSQCPNTPSLLLILADSKSDKRWVVTAVP